MNEAQSFLIGPFGLAVAVLTVVAFVAAMLHSLASTVVVSTDRASTHARSPRSTSPLRRVASARWPLAVIMALVTAYRIYSFS